MDMQRETCFRRTTILLALMGLVILAACQPAATQSVQTVVETVVTTQIVEGESVEVIVTATPAPSFEEPAATRPLPATMTPGPSPTPVLVIIQISPTSVDIEDRRIEVEWPVSMQPTESATVRLSFVPTEGGFEIVTEFPNDEITVTQVAIKQFTEHELSAIANLDGVGFSISPSGEQPKLVTEGEPLTWYWTVSPKQTGEQRLSISLALRWQPLAEEGRAREAVIYSKGLAIEVAATPNTGTRLGTMTMFCMVSLFGVGGIGLGVWLIGRKRSPRLGPVSPTPAMGFIAGMPAAGLVAGGGSKPGGSTPPIPPPSTIIIEPPPGLKLSPPETSLLSTLFSRYARLVIEREFLSGYSGARTFLAVPIRPDSRVDAHTIVKISDHRSVQQEYENYENYVKTTLPPATARIQQPPVIHNGLAALQYTFLGGAGYTPASLRQALLENPDPRLLWKLFDTFAPNWWMQHKPYVFRLGQEYDRKLPTHYVIEPVDAAQDAVLDGQNPTGLYPNLDGGGFSPGMILTLKNFSQAELRPDGKSLSLSSESTPGHPRLRVRWLAPTLGPDPVGRITATRWTILQDACKGLDLYDFPDPLDKLPALLGERVNGTQSLIHGDLNVENVLVGPGEWVWLIDFAETRDGHTLYDFAHLYTELIAHVIAPQIPHPPDFLEILGDGAEPLLVTVREMAGRCLFDPKQTREFDLALAVSCLGALKFANLTPHARHLSYLTAAYLAKRL
jgi:hypothetical protein